LAVYEHFFSDDEVSDFIKLGEERAEYKPADVRQPDGTYKSIPDYRQNLRGNVTCQHIATDLFGRSLKILPKVIRGYEVCSFYPNIKFYKYFRSDFFASHKDASIKDTDLNIRSLATWMVYLTSCGETHFEGHELIKGKAGTLIIFNHKVTHSSPPLEEDGPKIVMRTDVMYKYMDVL
jgi:hypothetical protein